MPHKCCWLDGAKRAKMPPARLGKRSNQAAQARDICAIGGIREGRGLARVLKLPGARHLHVAHFEKAAHHMLVLVRLDAAGAVYQATAGFGKATRAVQQLQL